MRKFIFIGALILILLSCASISSQTVSMDTSQTETLKQQEQFESLKKEFDELRKDNYGTAMENARRSIGLANLMIQVLILAVALMTGFGIFSYIKTGQIRKKLEEEVKEIRNLKEKMQENFQQEFQKTTTSRYEIETTKAKADSLLKDIDRIYEDVKKMAKDIEEAQKDVEEKKKSVDESKTEVSAISYFTEGNRLHDEKKYEEAIEKYKKATELKPDYAKAYVNWGVALRKLSRYEEAIEKYKKATELKPDLAEAYYNWGVALGKLGRYEEAKEKCRKVIELRPDFAKAWYNIACIYSFQDSKRGVLANLKKAIELDPSYKEKAKKDKDFKNLWEDEDFKKLVE